MRNVLMSIGAAAIAAAFMAGPVLADPAGGSLVSVNPNSDVDHDTLPVIRMPHATNIQSRTGMASANTSASLSPSHIQWCEAHYKSYRVSDDTFQPFNGPRELCVSPTKG